MKRIIIFDMGGVLVDLDVEICRKAFKETLGYERIDEILDSCIQTGILGDMECGRITADEFRSAVLADSYEGCSPEDVDAALRQIITTMASYKPALLKKLAESYDLYMLSNNNPICMPRVEEIFAEAGVPVDEIFRKCYISYQLKAMKPSVEFYKSIMADIGADPSEMIFIDDSKKNVEGALAAGLPAVHYEPGSDLAALLASELNNPSLSE